MPNYDRICDRCQRIQYDCLELIATADTPCACGGTMKRGFTSRPSAVISDECDIVVKHGICNEDGTPRRYRFKSEMRAEAKRRGLESHVIHIGEQGSDKSRHTSRWV